MRTCLLALWICVFSSTSVLSKPAEKNPFTCEQMRKYKSQIESAKETRDADMVLAVLISIVRENQGSPRMVRSMTDDFRRNPEGATALVLHHLTQGINGCI